MKPGQWFNNPRTEPPAEIKDRPKFAIMEWMVRKPYRQQGIGSKLLKTILSSRPEPYAILAANPDAPARQIYELLSWTYTGTTQGGFMPPMDIMALSLRGMA
jgi:hypothetical protein